LRLQHLITLIPRWIQPHLLLHQLKISASSSSTPAEDTESTEVSSSDNTTASADNTPSSSTPAEDTVTVEATTSNQTSINDSVTNGTTSDSTTVDTSIVNGTVIPGTNSTGADIPVNGTVIPGTNSTGADIPVNGTVIPGTNSTGADIPVNGTVIPGTNSTGADIPVNGTVIPGTNSTGADIPVNGTVIPGTNSTGADIPITIPNATESWSFDTQVNGSSFIGDVYIEETDSSLVLEGDGYLSDNGNSTSNISNLSVTAWANPDYSGGSAEFTVISKEGAFALTINNNIEPKQIATFSVFDGIKWHTVQTAEKIGDDWSHIAATFNGTTLSIYTNGTHSNTNESIEKITVTIDGQLEVKTIETIESTSDVVIGASLDNNRSIDDVTKQSIDDVTKQFFGEIKEVNIFNIYLTAQQIQEIYVQTLPLILGLQNNTTTDIIIEEIEIEVIDVLEPTVTNSTDILPFDETTQIILTNNTNTGIEFNGTQTYIPIEDEKLNEELNKLTISTYVNPDYTIGSTEFTVVSKESSFILGINNIISPERVATFSIFDGIMWTQITGITEINNWTHLAAIINGTEISLYVNGTQEAITTLPETFVISEGEMGIISAEVAENDSDLIVGAYLNTLRGKISLSNHFSGVINDVLVYKGVLSESELHKIYLGYIEPETQTYIPFVTEFLSFSDSVIVTTSSGTSTEILSSVTEFLSFSDSVIVTTSSGTSTVILPPSMTELLSFSDSVIVTTSSSTSTGILPSVTEFLSFGDSVTVTTSSGTSIVILPPSMTEFLPFADSVTIAVNSATFIEIDPKLTSMKESYLITEDAEFEFEFFVSPEILEEEKLKLENVTSVITDELEQSLSDSEITPFASTTSVETSSITQIISNIEEMFSVQMADAAKLKAEDITAIEIKEIKNKIKELKSQIKELSKNDKLDDHEIKQIKNDLKKMLKDLKSIAKKIEKSNDSDKADKIKKAIKSVEEAAGIEPTQIGGWTDSEKTIVTEIFDSDGNLVNLESKYEKIRDGKFSLKLTFDYNNKPGLYKIKTTFTMDGQNYVVEKEFAWGLVSLNTAKSIYRPGDVSDFIITVLDNGGHPVCNANLSMDITDPNSQITTLTSGNGITADEECGLYNAQFTTSIEGIHSVDINAQASGIDTNFSTTFSVLEYFEFDIVRTALSKIDPISNPNSFDVRIDIESFVGEEAIVIQETVPNVFDVITDAHVETVGNSKVLTWTKDLIDDKTSVEYSYSVPLEFPKLYALGPVEILYNESLLTFEEARPWFVASDPPVAQDWYAPHLGATCADKFENPGYLQIPLTLDQPNCTQETKYKRSNVNDNEEDQLIFFFDRDGGFDAETVITTEGDGEFNFKVKGDQGGNDQDGTVYWKLVELDPDDIGGTPVSTLDTNSAFFLAATIKGGIDETDISANGLTGIISAGNTFGYQLTYDTVGTDQQKKESKWAKNTDIIFDFSYYLNSTQSESLKLDDLVEHVLIIRESIVESLSLEDAVETTYDAIVEQTESLSLSDSVETPKDARVSLTEDLSLFDTPVTLKVGGLILVPLIETLLFSDDVQAFPITSSTLFGPNLGCFYPPQTTDPGPTLSFSSTQSSCETLTSSTVTTSDTLVHDIVTFYENSPGFTQNMRITGKALGNDFNASMTGFTGNINFTLVETTTTGTFVRDLDVVEVIGVEEQIGNIDLSGLTGIVDADKSFGIKVSMSSTNPASKDYKVSWGKDGHANERFMVDVTVRQGVSLTLLEELSLSDSTSVQFAVSLTESLSLDDNTINYDVPVVVLFCNPKISGSVCT